MSSSGMGRDVHSLMLNIIIRDTCRRSILKIGENVAERKGGANSEKGRLSFGMEVRQICTLQKKKRIFGLF